MMPLVLLWLAACGQQAPAPVSFHHRTEPTMEAAQPAGQSIMQQAAQQQAAMPAQAVQQAPEPHGGDIVVQRGDTLYGLARQHNLPPRALIDANNLQAPYILQPGQRLRLPGERLHMVQRGETLYAISRAYGVDVYSMASANQLQAPYAIAIGQALRVPGSSGAVAVAAASPVEPAATAPATRQASAFPVSPTSTMPAPTAPALTGTGVAVQELPPPGTSGPVPAPAVAPAPAAMPAPPPAKPAPLPEVSIPASPAQAAQIEPQPAMQPEPQVAAAPPVPVPAPTPTPVAAPAAPPAIAKPQVDEEPPPRSGRTFAWPVRGRILSTFGPKPDGLHNDGINIAARNGAPVIAAENGVVVYAGSELRGFGNLLLVRHADGWITAYAHLDRVLVQKGQQVKRGQAIATVGSSGAVDQPQLHFEIRRGTQAVDPAKFLTVAMLELFQPATTEVMAG
ncbi:MAG: peptidoglycan DD-metalloendopeptidase family protein [Ferrovibrio sp.]|nr:peptidoglycan DD-metalloendopeptidase family protein [Ferrovibrio sp.]